MTIVHVYECAEVRNMHNVALICGSMKWKTLMLATIICVTGSGGAAAAAAGSPQFTAMFAFGDSLIDPGNNNYLNSLAKANYVPYGIDFDRSQPTGRFSNGRTVIDYLGELLGIPILPAYTNPFATGDYTFRGMNYASAAGGILEETGQNLGERFSLSEQIQNFESTLNQLRSLTDDEQGLGNYLAKALVVMAMGSNDYINNYLQPAFYTTSYIYTPKDYADLLIKRYTSQILALHGLGLRKFLLGGIGPLGCIPNQLASARPPPGKCAAFSNDIVRMFNERLVHLVDQLNSRYNTNGSIFAYGNTYGGVVQIINNAKTLGFSVLDRACCGIGRYKGQITCLPLSVPCSNRDQHLFWDAFHPTQAVSSILARGAYSGPPSDVYPINVQKMGQL